MKQRTNCTYDSELNKYPYFCQGSKYFETKTTKKQCKLYTVILSAIAGNKDSSLS
jgi:hypothetical protein